MQLGQSIRTLYVPPTSASRPQIKAMTDNGIAAIFTCDESLTRDENHAEAARRLAQQLGWSGSYVPGGYETGFVFVNTKTTNPSFTIE